MRRPILASLSSGGGQPNLTKMTCVKFGFQPHHSANNAPSPPSSTRRRRRSTRWWRRSRRLIERLKEKRTALISRTVTRGLPPDAARAAGLDPHPKLKPSGIDWLGDVPERWPTLLNSHDLRHGRSLDYQGPTPGRRLWCTSWITDEEVPMGLHSRHLRKPLQSRER